MNKKTFASVTALTVVAGAVAGAVYYRHIVLRELDRFLHPRVQVPEEPSVEEFLSPEDL